MAESIIQGNWTTQYAGTPLDLTGFNLNFDDEFNTNSVGGNTGDPTVDNWFAPQRPTFGAATFVAPDSAVDPFSTANGDLTITMQQVDGSWQSGNMQTVNHNGDGYSQEYGYFEMRAKLPTGIGSWPGLAVFSKDSTVQRVEVDLLEAYGGDPNHHAAVHFTPYAGSTLTQRFDQSALTNMGGELSDGQFHTYGVMITPDWITVYMDRVELERFPSNSYLATPLFMSMDLAMNPAQVDQASGPSNMVVDYARAYADPTLTALVLPGTSASETLQGTQYSDTLGGSAGADTIIGGAGNDLIYVNNPSDVVIEQAGQGTDTVISSVSFSDGPQYIESIQLVGSDNINATGNGQANQLTGNAGNNVLDGQAGADTMMGGLGNDTYYVDNGGDSVVEATGQGTDLIISSVNFDLHNAGGVDNLTLTGSSAVIATGNWLNNVIVGNSASNVIDGASGNDTIEGGLGCDTLTGGTGQDSFVFDTPLNWTQNTDVIKDFTPADDTIVLSHNVFTALPTGALDPSAFDAAPAALDASDRIIYDRVSGYLYYDADGTGPISQIKFAVVGAYLGMSSADFVVT